MKTLEHRKAHYFFSPDQDAGDENNPAICSGGLLPGVQKIVNLKGPPGLLEEQLKLPIACPSRPANSNPSLTADIKDVAVPIKFIRIEQAGNPQDHSFSLLEAPMLISVVASQAAHIHKLKNGCQHRIRHASLPLIKNKLPPPTDFFTKAFRKTPVEMSSAKYRNRTSTFLRLHTDEILSKLALITSSPQVSIEHSTSPTPLQNKLPSDQQIGTNRQNAWPQ